MKVFRNRPAKYASEADNQESPESIENGRLAFEAFVADEDVLAEAQAEAEKAFAAVLERENAARQKSKAPLLKVDIAKQMLLFDPLFDSLFNWSLRVMLTAFRGH